MIPPDGSDDPIDSTAAEELLARRLIDNISSHAIFLIDDDGIIVTWPGPAETLYGFDSSSMVGRHVSELIADGKGTDTHEPLETALDDPSAESVEVERWHRRDDGSTFWGTLTLSPLSTDRFRGFAVVSQDTTIEREHERMLERQNDRLKEFTDILAHDLRNPLTVIDGHLTLYEDTGDDEHVEKIAETTARMERLVDDLLRVARQGQVVSDPAATDIGDIIRTAWQVVGDATDTELRYDEIPPVSGDADRLCELFENLFRNAVEHGSTDEHVTVHVGPLKSGFYVEDDGPGIPADRRQEVFDHGFTTAANGSGYGLSIVRTIVNAHGWDVGVTEGDAGGARFEITAVEFIDGPE